MKGDWHLIGRFACCLLAGLLSCSGPKTSKNRVSPEQATDGRGPALWEALDRPEFDHIDNGRDDVMNRILWFAAKGRQPYPSALSGPADDDDND